MRTRLAIWLVSLLSLPMLLAVECQPTDRVDFTGPLVPVTTASFQISFVLVGDFTGATPQPYPAPQPYAAASAGLSSAAAPAPPAAPAEKAPWYRRAWVLAVSAVLITVVFGAVSMIMQLAFLDLAAKACPPHVEATFFALLM